MIKGIKKWLFYRSFTVDSRRNVQQTHSVNQLKTVGVLFDGTSESERKLVHQFKKYISQSGRVEVKSLAFVDNRLPLDNVDYAAFNRTDINWYGIPSGDKVSEFIKNNFDLLIILTRKMLPQYEYIIAHSTAKFKVGPSIKRAENYLELIVDLPGDHNTELLQNNILKALNLVALK
ncbi:MAG TPA: hypothetical protein PK611_02620 [Saprospiraceae bacterium]|nr:hypothetical protein [Saprospiraceae bacterium]HRO07447.1 hypothetical protein [Saprospiraceae bacterium]HRO72541.1 hypothetical protein [Saprospiraceae bacterium]HRP40730.1 hypothetical protein [Saprospiraceae bacterium]